MSWADKFNLLDPIVDLRLICALFFIPHVVGKFTEPATLGFFVAAKFNPPATWMYIAGAIETVLTIALIERRRHKAPSQSFPQGGLADEGGPDPLDLDGARRARAVSRMVPTGWYPPGLGEGIGYRAAGGQDGGPGQSGPPEPQERSPGDHVARPMTSSHV